MTVPGSGGVDGAGQFNYSIPISTPPGTAGMIPHLSLNYSTGNDDGFEGYGWTLAGLDAITRCAASLPIDGVRGAVNYDASDKFCLNGAHLMLQSGTYGANNSVYYAYVTSFTKVILHSSGGTTWFEAQLPNGMVEQIGNTSDSQLVIPSTTTAREWRVNKIIDKKGNYLTVTYNNDATNGAIYPQRIDYTGNATAVPAVTPYNSVQFVYTSTVRADETPGYVGGYLTQIPYLLTDIKTYNGASVVLDYQLAYRAGSATTHSRLTSVTQCDGASHCMAPTTFDWQGGSGLPSSSTSSPGLTNLGVQAGDFTGDGLTDVLLQNTSCPSGGNIFAGSATGTVSFSSAGMTAEYSYWDAAPPHSRTDYSGDACFAPFAFTTLGDFDSDGRVDVLTNEDYWNAGVVTHVTTVLDSYPLGTGLTQLLPPPTTPAIPQFAVVGDFNGDGTLDGYRQSSSTVGLPYYAAVDGMFYAATSNITGTGTNNTLYPADFNGDGCADVLTQGGSSRAVYFLCSSVTSGAAGNYSGTVLTGDFNGDGNSDVLVVGASGTSAKIYLSTGEGLPTTGLTVTGSTGWSAYQVVLGDWNGDGKMDVALIGQGANHLIFLSTGTDFTQVASITNSISSVNARVADWNSDGADDIWLRQAGGDQVVAFPYQPEVITAVHNGIGATTSLAYAPLNTNGAFYTTSGIPSYSQLDGAYYVVSRQGIDDGASVTAYHIDYTYDGAVVDQTLAPLPETRGQMPSNFLAFTSIVAVDSRAGNPTTTTTYRTVLPLAGAIDARTLTVGATVISQTDYTYYNNVLNGSAAARLTKVVVTRNDLSGAALPTIQTEFLSYDSYNNPLTIKTTNLADSSTSTITNTFTNDTTNWILGQRTSTTVENVVGSSDITRHFNYTPDSTTGYNTQTNLEQGTTALEFDTNYQYDAYGNLKQVRESGTDITTRTSLVAFDSLGEFPATVTNAMSQVTTVTYDARFGGLTGTTDPNSVATSMSYDPLGRISATVDGDGTQVVYAFNYCSGVNGGSTSCPTHGAFAVSATPESPASAQNGAITTAYYDSLGRVIAQDTQGLTGSAIRVETLYTADGDVWKTSRPHFTSGGFPQFTVYSYDALHRVTAATFPDSSATSYCYNGLKTSVTNDAGQIKVTVRNNQGVVASVTEAASGDCTASSVTGTAASFTYDAFADMLTAQDPGGNTTTYTYDVRGRRITAAIPDRGGTTHGWSFDYYVDSTIKSQTDANGNSTTQTYDKLLRPLARTESGFYSKLIWDATNGTGNLQNACVNTTCTSGNYQLVPTYDSLARLSNQKVKLDGTSYNYTYSYDTATGNVASVVYPSGFQADYTYNSYGYLTQVTDHGTGNTIWQAAGADAELHLTSQKLGPNATAVTETATFDADTGRILTQCASTSSGTCNGNVLNFVYDWDTIGNLNSRQDIHESYTEKFCYDSLNRLTKSSMGTTCTSGATSKTFAYDASGNMTKKTDVCTGANCFAYGGGGNAGPHALSAITGTYNGVTNPSFTYDNNGNMLTGAGQSMSYTSFDQPSSISKGAASVALAYGTFHQRFKMCTPDCTSPTSTTNYLDDPMTGAKSEKVVAGSTTIWNDYVMVPGVGYVAVRSKLGAAVTWRYIGLDHLGSIATLADGTPSVVERDSYDPWGKRRNANGSDNTACSITSQTSRGYTGHEMLDSLCLVNMNARVYDPSLGRFQSADSVVPGTYNTQSYNRFSYVDNNPLAFTDPSGRVIVAEAPHDFSQLLNGFVDFNYLGGGGGPYHGRGGNESGGGSGGESLNLYNPMHSPDCDDPTIPQTMECGVSYGNRLPPLPTSLTPNKKIGYGLGHERQERRCNPKVLAWANALRNWASKAGQVGTSSIAAGGTTMLVAAPFAPETAGISEIPGFSMVMFGMVTNTVSGVADFGGALLQGYETGNWGDALKSGGLVAAGYFGGRFGDMFPTATGRAIVGLNVDSAVSMLGDTRSMSCPVN